MCRWKAPFSKDTFPGRPLVPGVLLIETMAQASGFMLLSRLKFEKMPFLANVTSAKMRTFVEPGEVLRVEARTGTRRLGICGNQSKYHV